MNLNPFIIIFLECAVTVWQAGTQQALLLIETSHTTRHIARVHYLIQCSRKQMIDTPFDQKYWSVVFVLFWPMREIGTNRSNPFIFSIVFQIE